MEQHLRDFVGYGATPPDPKWPGGARIAVQIVMNYEEGSEHAIGEGDETSETYLTEVPGATLGPGKRDLIVESVYEYGSRTGFWRLMRMFGPFAHLRGNSVLASDVKIGNFVELKNADLAEGVKANHLANLGDAAIGPRSNIGAGTITANFDGVRKNRTEIGADVKIGSNNTLVAPVTVGDAAVTGAGAVVNRDVEPGDKVAGVPARSIAKKPAGT